MTVEELSTDYTNCFPVSFHVFGIGERFKPILEKISALGYDGVSAETITPAQSPLPTEEDRMVIIMTDESIDSLIEVAKCYYQAGVLTLTVASRQIESQPKFCEAQLVSNASSLYKSIKAILDIIINKGRIVLAFNEIRSVLHDSGFFKVVETIGKGGVNRMTNALSKIENIISHIGKNAIEGCIISIFFNRDIQPPISMFEMKTFSDFLSCLPEEINVIWGVGNDDNLPPDEVRLTAILSGNNI